MLIGSLILGGSKADIDTSSFTSTSKNGKNYSFSDQSEFFFGIATAPAHVEDELDDIWLDFATGKKRGVKAFHNAGFPEKRLNFWTEPEVELDLAQELGTKVFRLGVDWGRLMPHKPGTKLCGENGTALCPNGIQDQKALARYKEIVQMIRERGMAVMMTLYHHSMPKWSMKLDGNRGWSSRRNTITNYFVAFARDVAKEFAADVDYWIIFNEPAVYASLSYGMGIWPPGNGMDPTAIFDIGILKGKTQRAMDNMITAHNKAYKVIKEVDTITTGDTFIKDVGPSYVGIAHNIAFYTSGGLLDKATAMFLRSLMNYEFLDGVVKNLDFMGLNYYGEEIVKGISVPPQDNKEYSESGRAINPNGLYNLLIEFNNRYSQKRRKLGQKPLPIIITENGISDASDKIRPLYLTEHLAAIAKAKSQGVPVEGYIFWTISDNWEWADGYCPKFGLVSVDRSTPELIRTKRGSFNLYKDIVTTGKLYDSQREDAFNHLVKNYGTDRPFCRSSDGKNSLDVPEIHKVKKLDWRFK